MKLKMIWVMALLAFNLSAFATDTLSVVFNKKSFQPGDTIAFAAGYPSWVDERRSGTLNVVLEDVNHTMLWRLRYPVIEGITSASIVLPDSIPHGAYALYFRLQNDFFKLKGKVLSPYRDSTLRYTMLLADKEFMVEDVKLDEKKEFKLKRLLFADKATIFFGPRKSNRANNLEVKIEVSLDSAYKTVDESTTFITVGHVADPKAVTAYRFDTAVFDNQASTLKMVEVVGQKKTIAAKFEEERVSGMFKSMSDFSFDNSDNAFDGQMNIFEWLRGRVPGLSINNSADGFSYSIKWRGSETALFWNEMQVDEQMISSISPGDIAYVKVFRPPFYGAFMGGAGGAIAIYTKDGTQLRDKGPRHSFSVNGYTPEIYTIPVKNHAE